MDLIAFRVLAAVPKVIGAILIVLAILKYRRLLKRAAETNYESMQQSSLQEKGALFMLYLFLAGFIIGTVDTFFRIEDPMYLFISLIFLLGSLFIYLSIAAQEKLFLRLREKTMETMKTFVKAIDMKDSYTKGHSTHVFEIVSLIYEELDKPQKDEIEKPKLLDAALLHDIGKMGIKDEILNKPDGLTPEEWEVIKTHPLNGSRMLEDTCYFEIADWVLYHHERMDGKGYYGLSPDEIPIESKLIAVADTYSALRTDRVYRRKKTHAEAVAIMEEAAGAQLDTAIVERFLQVDEGSLERLRY